MTPIIETRGLRKEYSVRNESGWGTTSFAAISDIDMVVAPGETLCIVGESGCGKSTLARVLAGLAPADGGELLFDGKPTRAMSASERRDMRRRNQFIFQDPYASLNPRWTLGQIIAEPLENFTDLSARQRRDETAEMLERVGLRAADAAKRPREISGGQRQRVGIARAIICKPDLVIADEAVSALDVSVKAQILNLMLELQKDLNLSYVFITHDVGAVRSVADRVMVMYLGRVMEAGPATALLDRPNHPYTKRLVDSLLIPDPTQRMTLSVNADEVPSALNPPTGCVFRTRCEHADAACAALPAMQGRANGRTLACHHPLDPQQS